MKLPRRQFLHLAAGAAALPAVSRIAWAQAYPSRPVRMSRLCRRRRGRHPRAPDRSMAVGAARPAIRHREPAGCRRQYRYRGGRESPPDGYTLLLTGTPNTINATLYDKLNFNFIRDIAPVAGIVRFPMVMGSIHRFRPRRFPSSSRTPRPIRARSIWRRPAMAARPHGRRAIQDDDWRQYGARALSRRAPGAHRPARRASAGHVRQLLSHRLSISGLASYVRSR